MTYLAWGLAKPIPTIQLFFIVIHIIHWISLSNFHGCPYDTWCRRSNLYLATSKLSLTEKLTNRASVTPTNGPFHLIFEISQTCIGIRARTSNNIHENQRDVITHPCPSVNGGIIQPPLKLGSDKITCILISNSLAIDFIQGSNHDRSY